MKTLQKIAFVLLFTFGVTPTAYAAFPPFVVNQGGTGWNMIQAQAIPFGLNTLRLATSSAFTFDSSLLKLNVTNYQATTGTTTSATSTDFYVSGLASTTNLRANVANIGNLTFTSCSACGSSFAWPWTKLSTNEQATSTTMAYLNGILVTASSTFNTTLLVTGSSTLQTTSIIALRNLTSNGFVKTGGAAGTLSVDTNVYQTYPWPWTKLGTNEQATTSVMSFQGGFIAMASSTASSLVATSTNLNVSANHISFGSNYVNATATPAWNIASTTLDALGKSYSVGTTSLILANYPESRTMVSFWCVASSTGSVIVRFGDGTNWSQAGNCSTTGKQWLTTSNNTWTPYENFVVEVGTSASSPSRVTITPVLYKTSD